MTKNKLITPTYEDEKGKYKICEECKNKLYYDAFKSRMSRMKNKNFAPHLFKHLKYCSTECKNKIVNKPKICEHCGKEHIPKSYGQPGKYKKSRFCSVGCVIEFNTIKSLAINMGLTYDILKKELIVIAKKYSK